MNSLLGIQSVDNSVYEGLKKAREDAIKAGMEIHESLRQAAKLEKEGRVPFAFRLTSKRISRADAPVRWRDYFPHFFPMYKTGGTEIGIIHSKHICDSMLCCRLIILGKSRKIKFIFSNKLNDLATALITMHATTFITVDRWNKKV